MQINSLAQVKPFNKIAILHHTRNICFHSHRDKNNRNFQAMPYASINVSQDRSTKIFLFVSKEKALKLFSKGLGK